MSKSGKIILIDRVEIDADQYGSYLKIYDMSGATHRIAEKRREIWGIFQNARQWQPILCILETYKGNTYIAGAKDITDEILSGAIVELGQKVIDKVADEKNRSTALSYAKDLVIGDKITLKDLFAQAQKNYEFIKGREV